MDPFGVACLLGSQPLLELCDLGRAIADLRVDGVQLGRYLVFAGSQTLAHLIFLGADGRANLLGFDIGFINHPGNPLLGIGDLGLRLGTRLIENCVGLVLRRLLGGVEVGAKRFEVALGYGQLVMGDDELVAGLRQIVGDPGQVVSK